VRSGSSDGARPEVAGRLAIEPEDAPFCRAVPRPQEADASLGLEQGGLPRGLGLKPPEYHGRAEAPAANDGALWSLPSWCEAGRR